VCASLHRGVRLFKQTCDTCGENKGPFTYGRPSSNRGRWEVCRVNGESPRAGRLSAMISTSKLLKKTTHRVR